MKLGLISRIALALAIVGLIPLAVGVGSLVGINRTALQDQVLQNHVTAARAAASRLGSILTSLEDLGGALADNAVVREAPRSAEAQEVLASILSTRADLGGLAVTGPDGGLVLRLQRRDAAADIEAVLASTPSPRPRYLAPRHLTQSEAGPERPWLLVDSPIPGGGHVRLVADPAPLAEAIDSIELAEGQADMVLADGEGRVLAGNVASLDSFPEALIEAGASGQVSGAKLYPQGDGERILGAVAPVPRSGWFVASRQPAAVAERVAVAMRRRSLIAIAVALGLVALLVTTAQLRLVRPIRELIGAQQRLAGLDPSLARGSEIHQLRSSFATLERQLKAREEIDRVFLGRYQVRELIDEGAMGSVFEGWDPKLQRPVALKTVRLGEPVPDANREKLTAQLVREATTAARLIHPNIVSVFDVEDAPDVAFIAMELVDGLGLDDLLRRRGSLDEASALVIGLATARALAHSHARNVVHRDIKPGNVLLGRSGSIKVTDFGIAELLTSLVEDSDTVIGTPGYIPPESLLGEGFFPEGDLFALGVVLYECLTGRHPFAARSIRKTTLNTLQEEPPPVRLSRPEVSVELAFLVGELLAKKPEDRPPGAAQVVARLEDLVRRSGAVWKHEAWLPPKQQDRPRPRRSSSREGRGPTRGIAAVHTQSLLPSNTSNTLSSHPPGDSS